MLYKPFFVVFLKFGHCVLCIYCFDLDVGAVFFVFTQLERGCACGRCNLLRR